MDKNRLISFEYRKIRIFTLDSNGQRGKELGEFIYDFLESISEERCSNWEKGIKIEEDQMFEEKLNLECPDLKVIDDNDFGHIEYLLNDDFRNYLESILNRNGFAMRETIYKFKGKINFADKNKEYNYVLTLGDPNCYNCIIKIEPDHFK